MRISTVGIFILTALIVKELSLKVNATPSSKLSKDLDAKNFITTVKTPRKSYDRKRDVLSKATPTGSRPVSSAALEGSEIAVQTISALLPEVDALSIKFPSPVTQRQAPTVGQAPTDVQNHWAQDFIKALAARQIIQGFPDGTFRPDEPVTRSQFAVLIQKAFQKSPIHPAIEFVDVPTNFWARTSIMEAYEMGFLEGFPGSIFNPNQNIPRIQALVSLVKGLRLSAIGPTATVLDAYFQDASDIPEYARNSVAAAIEKRLVVNYPNVAYLNPERVATRADMAAFIYQALVTTGVVPPVVPAASASKYIVGHQPTAFGPPSELTPRVPSPGEIQHLQSQLRSLQNTRNFGNVFQGSPAITISNPSGFGADNNTGFISTTYQSRTRFGPKNGGILGIGKDDGALGVGIGLGDARQSVGVELAYTIASFGTSRSFGSGGFDVKVHHQFPGDLAVAVGYDGFLNVGDRNDFKDSAYGVVTKVFRTRDDVNSPFSRVAVSAGLGNGFFRSEGDISRDNDTVNLFGSVAVRVVQPVSFITEWTGQDLGLGLSIVPFKNLSLVITPAVRDVTGAGDGPRFVLGAGFSFRF